MFESDDDLNFCRKEGSVSKTVEITLEAVPNEDGTAPMKGKPIKVGASVFAEHLKKEDKMIAIRRFLKDKNPKCCSRGDHDPCGHDGVLCFGAFKDCLEQETAVENLRLKYFGPHISQKDRRNVLLKELQSMTSVLDGKKVVKFKINQRDVCK